MTVAADSQDQQGAAEIRELVEARVRAVAERDVDALAAVPSDDVLQFDVLPPLGARGNEAVAAHMREWFDGYAAGPGYDVTQLETGAAGDLGWAAFYYHVTGTLHSGDEVSMWVRATLVCRRLDGVWRVVHDHESVPFDPETGQAVIGMEPPDPEG